MRKSLCQLAVVIMALCLSAKATTYTVNSGQSQSTIQGIINSASVGDTVAFAAGTYNVTSSFNLKCGITYIGPTIAPWNWVTKPSATIATSTSGITLFAFHGGCPSSVTTRIAYIGTSGGGYLYADTSNYAHVHFDHIAELSLPYNACCSGANTSLFFDGDNAASTTDDDITITYSILGDSNSCTSGYPRNDGTCAGITFAKIAYLTNVVVQYNYFYHLNEGAHWLQVDYVPNHPETLVATCGNCNVQYNYFDTTVRVPLEFQHSTLTSPEIFSNNVFNSPVAGATYAQITLSAACCSSGRTEGGNSPVGPPAVYIQNNIHYNNLTGTNSTPEVYEIQGGVVLTNNVAQGNICGGIAYGGTNQGVVTNNTIQSPTIAGGSPGCQYIYPECTSPCAPQTVANNTFTGTVASFTSVAPTISPSVAPQTFPLTVTLTDPGYSSGNQPLGNTGIWYTTDGSTPVPGSNGTYAPTGGTFVLASPATVKAVGMWGTPPQPTSYPAGYGFTPSSVVTSTFTSSGCSLTAGATVAQIQTALNSAGSGSCPGTGGHTVSFGAGSYTITGGLTLPCGVTVTATVPASPSNVVLNATFTEESTDIFNMNGGCSTATTISYLSTLHAGLVFVNTPNSNLTITHNQVGDLKCCRSQAYSPAMYFNDPSSTTTNFLANATITWNSLGDATSCTAPQNAMTYTTDDAGYDGNCTGATFQTSINGLTFENNNIFHVGEGVHVLCYGNSCSPGDSPAGPLTYNLTAEFNDISNAHRIGWEEQPEAITGITIQYNSLHSWFNPYFGSFGFSMACCANPASFSPYLNEASNLVLFDTVPTPTFGVYGYGIEAFGTHATYANNLVETVNYSNSSTGAQPGPGIAWGRGIDATSNFSYNTVCGPVFARSGGFIVSEGFGGPPPTLTGNVTTSTCPTITSAAPTLSPSAGAHAFPLTVTVTDSGYTAPTTTMPLGNTGIWYTTDGTTPVPGSGTAKYLATGQTFVLAGPATVQAVGMWGAPNQPTSYASGFGFVPSAVVSAAYTSGTGVTLTGATIAPTGGVSTIQIGGTVQMIVTCDYSDGSTSGCNTTDSHGNTVTSWASSSANATVSSSGLVTGAAVGTANITATVTGGFITSPASTITVNAGPLTLSSVSVATTGAVSSITAGSTNQLITTCHYNDGTTTSCNTMDSHGNAVTTASSSAPTIATVTSPAGLVTGVAGGSTNLTTTVVPTPSMLGTSLENVTGATGFGFINEIYGVTGTSAAGYTPGDCHITIPATTNWTAGKLWTCLLVLGTPTTQNVSALCSNSFTLTGTSWPGGDIVIPMASVCPTLPPDTGYWVGSTTSQTTASPTQGFSNCNSQCNGPAPVFGSGTYAYRYIPNTFGNYTSLQTTLNTSGSPGQQVSQYILLTTTTVTSNSLPLTVTSAPPSLVSAYLTGTSSLVVPNTTQLAAKCHYTSGPDQDCTVADIYGDKVTMWVTSDATKATVSSGGLVTAVAAGTPSITAVINNAMNSTAFPMTITNTTVSLTGISLTTAGGVTGLFVGSTNQLKATCTYSDSSSTDCTNTDSHGNKANTYVSTTPAHATVGSTTGLVTGVAAGATTFTAHAGSFTSTAIPVTILAVPTGIYSITITGPVKFSGSVRF